MGHSIKSVPLAEVYNLPTVEVLFEEYKKATPELTIDSTARKDAELVIKQKRIDDLEEKQRQIDNLEERLQKIEYEKKRDL